MRKYGRPCERSHQDIPAPIRTCAGLAVLLVVLLGAQGCGSSPKAMDVIWSADYVDHNGFARNPVWYQMTQAAQPPDPCAFCPCGSKDPQDWMAAANCTHQSLHWNESDFCHGHMNWLPVEYEATVTWAEHSKGWWHLDDDDYFFYVKRPDQALKTAGQGDTRDGIEIEFDSGETVDYWDGTGTWWEQFHGAVDSNDGKTGGPAGNMIDGHQVIIIGLVGLDTQHEVHSELHPVYAMFVRLPQNIAGQDRWAFFVRNWGIEGGCGSDQEYLEPLRRNQLQVLIPHAIGTGFALGDINSWVYGDDEDERNQQSWSYQPVADGLLLTFRLRDPSKQVGFVGDLTINWGQGAIQGSASLARPTAPEARPSLARSERSDGDKELIAKIEKLDPATQKLLSREVKNLTHHPPCRRMPGTLSTAAAPQRVKPRGKYPTYGNIVKSVPDTAGQAKKAKQREAILAFLKARGIE
jgi:hypothetical protein